MAAGDLLGHDLVCKVDDLQNFRVFQGVEDFDTFLAAKENAGRNHQVEVARGIGLLFPYGGEDLADASLAGAEEIDDLESGGLTESFQDFCLEMSFIHSTLRVYMTIQSYIHGGSGCQQ